MKIEDQKIFKEVFKLQHKKNEEIFPICIQIDKPFLYCKYYIKTKKRYKLYNKIILYCNEEYIKIKYILDNYFLKFSTIKINEIEEFIVKDLSLFNLVLEIGTCHTLFLWFSDDKERKISRIFLSTNQLSIFKDITFKDKEFELFIRMNF